eukprot:GDKK01016860.1.p1 GENE.GDKK01016860.1~~GDKK01016860.1.p1  ORF type:complete len:345 (-),score=94.80 GDKK01016860.1:4-996(-)
MIPRTSTVSMHLMKKEMAQVVAEECESFNRRFSISNIAASALKSDSTTMVSHNNDFANPLNLREVEEAVIPPFCPDDEKRADRRAQVEQGQVAPSQVPRSSTVSSSKRQLLKRELSCHNNNESSVLLAASDSPMQIERVRSGLASAALRLQDAANAPLSLAHHHPAATAKATTSANASTAEEKEKKNECSPTPLVFDSRPPVFNLSRLNHSVASSKATSPPLPADAPPHPSLLFTIKKTDTPLQRASLLTSPPVTSTSADHAPFPAPSPPSSLSHQPRSLALPGFVLQVSDIISSSSCPVPPAHSPETATKRKCASSPLCDSECRWGSAC